MTGYALGWLFFVAVTWCWFVALTYYPPHGKRVDRHRLSLLWRSISIADPDRNRGISQTTGTWDYRLKRVNFARGAAAATVAWSLGAALLLVAPVRPESRTTWGGPWWLLFGAVLLGGTLAAIWVTYSRPDGRRVELLEAMRGFPLLWGGLIAATTMLVVHDQVPWGSEIRAFIVTIAGVKEGVGAILALAVTTSGVAVGTDMVPPPQAQTTIPVQWRLWLVCMSAAGGVGSGCLLALALA